MRKGGCAFIVTAAALAAAGLPACGSVREGPSARRNFTLEQAKAFDDFPLYYAGDRVDGLPLVAILRRSDTARYVSFVYGDCTPASYEGGCAPPAEVQIWPATDRDLDSYASPTSGTPLPETTTIGGLPAALFDDGARLEVFTDRSTVVVFSGSRGRTLEIARALRCVTEPASGPRAGTLDC